MGLADRLKKKKCASRAITIDGDVYNVTGLSLRAKAAAYATCRDKSGKLDQERLDAALLAACVSDETGDTAKIEDWLEAPSSVTGPLVSAVIEVNGMDREDLGDPKDEVGDSSETPS